MAMVLTEEQQLLKDSAREFIQAKSPITELRKLRDNNDATGYSKELWSEMAEMGWTGILIPEEYGGLGFGYQGLGIVLEEAGRNLVNSPLISTVLTCGSAVLLGGSDDQKSTILPRIATGELIMALAIDEKPHHAPTQIATTAKSKSGGYEISGEKTFVLDGHVAETLVVVARTTGAPGHADGLTLFLVAAKAPGVSITRTNMVDCRNAANITFSNVQVSADDVLGTVDQGSDLLEQILDRARIGLASEMLGSAQQVFDVTLEYLKERTQFGKKIGTFQALQHRAALMFADLELSRSVVTEALSAIDENANNVPHLACLAKGKLSDVFHKISREGIQMHGGIGMTDEHDIGLYLKRSMTAEQTFGAGRFHRDRYAALEGY
jgi:alkylation response protein AidB-like acyl-CoA dehydrogenase